MLIKLILTHILLLPGLLFAKNIKLDPSTNCVDLFKQSLALQSEIANLEKSLERSPDDGILKSKLSGQSESFNQVVFQLNITCASKDGRCPEMYKRIYESSVKLGKLNEELQLLKAKESKDKYPKDKDLKEKLDSVDEQIRKLRFVHNFSEEMTSKQCINKVNLSESVELIDADRSIGKDYKSSLELLFKVPEKLELAPATQVLQDN